MSRLAVTLFGKPSIHRDDQIIIEVDSKKVMELFCYLLMFRERPHHREKLAGFFWGNATTTQSKKYLRQGIWRLQSKIKPKGEADTNPILFIEPEWIQINPEADLQLDVDDFEHVYDLVKGKRGKELDRNSFTALRNAIELYQGDLLEGWYEDWCIFERERFKNMYLAMLDKLIGYCEVHKQYENGLNFGERILYYDIARERTHRRMIRLYLLAGQRTSALRQYHRCVTALQDELGAQPSKRTTELYEQIQLDQLGGDHWASPIITGAPSVPEVLNQLEELSTFLTNFQHQVSDEIRAVQNILEDH